MPIYLHLLDAVTVMGHRPPDDPWPVVFSAIGALLFIGIVAGAAMIVNRRERRREEAETPAAYRTQLPDEHAAG